MSKVKPFLVGAAIGALAALLFAPHAGEKTRALVAEKANAVAGEAKDFGSSIPGIAQDAFKSAQEKGQGFVSDAQARVKGVAGQPAEVDADDLREKIEAARQRIAAQVMENAEQSKAVEIAAEAAEAVAEVAEEAAEAAAEVAEEAAEAATEAAEAATEAVEEAAEAVTEAVEEAAEAVEDAQ